MIHYDYEHHYCGLWRWQFKSVQKAFAHLGHDAVVSKDPDTVAAADVMVLPGQGAFGTAMRHLEDAAMVDVVKAHIAANKPFLGICVGFQLLFEGSEEMGSHHGLGIFPGTLRRFDGTPLPRPNEESAAVPSSRLKVPQMGWNAVTGPNTDYHRHYYFVHSYYVPATGADFEEGICEYGTPFVAIARRGNLLACQFHPEKSGDAGMALIGDFMSLIA